MVRVRDFQKKITIKLQGKQIFYLNINNTSFNNNKIAKKMSVEEVAAAFIGHFYGQVMI